MLWLLVVLPLTALAGTAEGIGWLVTQQNTDGSFGTVANSPATPYQSTAEVLRAYQTLKQQAQPPYTSALGFLNSDAAPETEYLVRQIIVNAVYGNNVDTLIARLLSYQDSVTGSFGVSVNYDWTAVLDTAFALEALTLAGVSDATVIAPAVGFLMSRQQASGGWADGENVPSVYLTALTMRALWYYRHVYVGVPAALTAAQNFLLSQRAASGLWNETFDTALSLIALIPHISDLSLITQSAAALQAAQLANGSWDNDAYTTALALQALKAFELRGGGTSPQNGSLSGNVINAGSTEPIAGATVTVNELPGISVLSNGDGYFLIPGLPPGAYTITAGKAGFSPASKTATVVAGQVTLAGQLVLGLATQAGLVRGRVFDDADRSAIPGAVVTLTSATTLSVLTQANGQFDFGTVAPGVYSVSIEKSGYYPVGGSATVVGGQTLLIPQGLVKVGTFQDTNPGTITGTVVNAKTGAPIAGATFDLGGGRAATTAANGQFTIASVPRGNYTATLSASGYVTQTYSISFPPGALGNLGTLSLFPTSATTAPTTLTLNGQVVDGVSNAPIAGASVTLVETGASATTGADGRFTLAGITLKNFTLALAATGYTAATFGIQVTAFGVAQVTLALSPPGTGATTSTLQGVVTNAQTGAPIAGAQLSIDGTGFSAATAADGSYTLSAIDTLSFTVTVTAVGFAQTSSPVQLASHGSYTLNPTLEPVTASNFQVLSVSANQPNTGANATALFTAQIANLLAESKNALVIGEVVDANGAFVATLTAYAEGTTIPTSEFIFAANETKILTIPWPTAQFAPGTYRVIVRAVEPGTINQIVPLGQVLAENATLADIVATSAIAGAMALDPPLTQAGTTTPVTFTALVRNASNVPLPVGNLELMVTHPVSGAVLYAAQATVGALDVGIIAPVSFGGWVPTQSGNLPVRVRSTDLNVAGDITGFLYVGDKASATFTVDKTVVPEGTQTVRGKIDMQGVDVRTGDSTDPLYPLVKEAVRRGGVYTAPEAVNWHTRNRCLGCHIQTQSLYGLASSLDKADVDAAAATFLYNAVAGSQQANGSLIIAYPQYARTQTMLSAWSLATWPDKAGSFRTKYKSAAYLHGVRTDSGSVTYWNGDHSSSGWWATTAAYTALSTEALADLLRSVDKIDLSQVQDYALSNTLTLGPGGATRDIEIGPGGALYVLKYSGQVNVVDRQTGQSSTLVSGLPANSTGLAVAPDGTVYVTTEGGQLIRVLPDGTRTTIYSQSGVLRDVEIGPDGALYISDQNGNRLLRMQGGATPTVFVSGGLLKAPNGLAFDSAGNLLVANRDGFNILQVAPDKTVTILADGLAYPPLWLDVTADGTLYVSTSNYSNTGQNTPFGLYRIRAGVAERLLSGPTLRGVVVADGKAWVANESTNMLSEIATSPLVTSSLPNFRSDVERAARYFLGNYKDNSVNNMIQAMRMIGMAEARTVVTDTTLGAQLDSAIGYANTLLRGRQRADGGWGANVGNAGDPLVTAMVGIAIDYTEPSPDDPLVRKTILYLLNTQQADGSWKNVNNGLTTKLAATSFVMAYLPRALERLGGIDIDLHVNVAANVALGNPTVQPTAVLPATGGGQEYTWKLLGVTGAGRTLEFDLTLLDMQPNETRAVAQKAYLEFANSFNNDRLQVALPIPTVSTAKSMTLAVATDKQIYSANEPVAIASTVTNSGPTVASGQVQLIIRAPGSTTALAQLAPIPVTNLAVGAQQIYPVTWNTGTTLVGGYEVHGRLFDTQGRFLSESVAPFTIQQPAAAPVVSLRVTTDRPIYHTTDLVAIQNLVANLTTNVIVDNATLRLTIRDPANAVLFTKDGPLGQLVPGALLDIGIAVPLSSAPLGMYRIDGQVRDSAGAVLATGGTGFEVRTDLSKSLTGKVTVGLPTVERGTPQTCTDTVTNVGSQPIANLEVHRVLVNLDTQVSHDDRTVTLNLAIGQVNVDTRTLATTGLLPGNHACVLQARIDGALKTLAYSPFVVTVPPIKVDASLSLGTKGRVLVLLDSGLAPPPAAVSDSDPHGPTGAPLLSAQRTFLEKLLTDHGWSYTITTAADDFTRELHTGAYNLYAVFAEQEKLSETAQKELREAIFRGEGLIMAGIHDARHLVVHDALGIKLIGQVTQAASGLLTTSPLGLTGGINLLAGDKTLRIKRLTAQSAGVYVLGNPPPPQGPIEPDCRALGEPKGPDECNGQPNNYLDAFTLNTYGLGKAFFAGFDLLAQATLDGDAGLAAQTLLAALTYATPTPPGLNSGGVIPLSLALQNRGIATTVTVVLTLPTGVGVVDPGTGTLTTPTTVRWDVPLAVDEAKTLTLWVRLPTTAGAITFNATVHTQAAPIVLLADPSTTLTVLPPADLTASLASVEALIAQNHPEAQTLKQVSAFLNNALKAPKPEHAVFEVLKAADALLGFSDPALITLRVALGEWVREAGMRGY